MAKVKITGHASGSGVITVTAPNTSTDRTITLPDATATIATTTDVAARLPSITDGGNATAMTINSSEKVGIGTASPQNKVHIATGDSSNNNFRTNADTPLIIETAGTGAYIEFVADSGQPMGILMGDTSVSNDTGSGGVVYDSNGGGLFLKSGGSARLYAATDGKIGINGEDSPDAALHIGGSSGWIDIGAGNRTKVGFDSNHAYIGSSASAGKVVFKSGISSTGNPADSGTETAAILATGGITFNGDTAVANALDDYEEGTWTAIIRGSTGSAGSAAQNSSTGYYIKVGNLVQVSFEGYMTNKGSWSGNARIYGLPYTVGYVSTGSLASFPSTAVDAAMRAVNIPANNSYIVFKKGSKLDVAVPFSEIVTGYYFSVSATYRV